VEHNDPAGSIFWIEIPYVAACDRGRVIATDMTWEADGRLKERCERMIRTSSSGRGVAFDGTCVGTVFDYPLFSTPGSSFDSVKTARSHAHSSSLVMTPSESFEEGGGKCVLLIEDDAMTRRLMVRGFKKQGFDVAEACNGRYKCV
jgi:hypothetical protein